ncbi:MAG: hypothetical protein MJZ75_02120 [Paludibacteraceae bacterium]|nr:hypothetical protein [Paludibacteraceae bacterium]
MNKKLFTFFVALCCSMMMVAQDYLCFTAVSAKSAVSLQYELDDWTLPTVEYSLDAQAWKPFIIGEDTIHLDAMGDKVYFRGTTGRWSFGTDRYVHFTMLGTIAASGNIMSLIDPTCQLVSIPTLSCFNSLFIDCTALVSAPEMPAVDLLEYCYQNMYKGCTKLTETPYLPASKLVEYCYAGMFEGCSALNHMNVNFERWSPANATLNWAKDVAPTGIFDCPNTLDSTKIDESHIPFGWIRQNFPGTPGLFYRYEANGKVVEVPVDSIQYIHFEKSESEEAYQMSILTNDGAIVRTYINDIDSLSIIGYVNDADNTEALNQNDIMFLNDADKYPLNVEDFKNGLPVLGLEGQNLIVNGKTYPFDPSVKASITFDTKRVFASSSVDVCRYQFPYIWVEADRTAFDVPATKEFTFKGAMGRDSIHALTVTMFEPDLFTTTRDTVVCLNELQRGFVWAEAGHTFTINETTWEKPLRFVDRCMDSVITYNVALRQNAAEVIQLFPDVIAIDNPANEFSSYQWYKNGVAISGATGQYYQDPNGLNGIYYVVTNGGTTLDACSCNGYFDAAPNNGNNVAKRLVNEHLVIIMPDGAMYDAEGNRL